LQGDKTLYGQFFRTLFESGVYFSPSVFEAGFMSTAHTDEIINTMMAAKKTFKSW